MPKIGMANVIHDFTSQVLRADDRFCVAPPLDECGSQRSQRLRKRMIKEQDYDDQEYSEKPAGFWRRAAGYLHIESKSREANSASALNLKALHKAFRGSHIANNGYDRSMAMATVVSGHADTISFGRGSIGNPDLVEHLRRDAPLFNAPHDACYGGGAEGYTDFASLID